MLEQAKQSGLLLAGLMTIAIASEAPSQGRTDLWGGERAIEMTETIRVANIPADAKGARLWLWLPNEDAQQRLLDLDVVEAPAAYQIVRQPKSGDRVVYLDLRGPFERPPEVTIRCVVDRTPGPVVDASTSSAVLGEDHRLAFASELAANVPNMEVDRRIVALASEICGEQTDVLAQAKDIYDFVIERADHYSKGAVKASPDGSQSYCLDAGGGSCTDMHSLFIALCRARGIPARITFGSRMQPKNEGIAVDPGYRCWASIFCPGRGWLPVDVAAGDTSADRREAYFGSIDADRIGFVSGRNLDLVPGQDGPTINIITKTAYVEVDGAPHPDIERSVVFRVIDRADRVSQASLK